MVRVEQLYPFPEEQLDEIFDTYPNATRSVLGSGRAREHGGLDLHPSPAQPHGIRSADASPRGPAESASPATGSQKVHEQELEDILNRAFEPPSHS